MCVCVCVGVCVCVCMCVCIAHTSVSLSKRMSLFLKICLDQQDIRVLLQISKTGCTSALEQHSERNRLVWSCSATLDCIVQKTFVPLMVLLLLHRGTVETVFCVTGQ